MLSLKNDFIGLRAINVSGQRTRVNLNSVRKKRKKFKIEVVAIEKNDRIHREVPKNNWNISVDGSSLVNVKYELVSSFLFSESNRPITSN